MQKWDIWMEGFHIQGMDTPQQASLVATVEAKTFQEACDLHYVGNFNYNRQQMTDWGCRLFDNEADARKLFG